jgi:transcriptional regulator with XRE-family HTH domain
VSAGGDDPEELEFRALVAASLRGLREDHGLDYGDVAALLGLRNPFSTGKVVVWRWETGRVSPARHLPLALLVLKERLAKDRDRWDGWLAGKRKAGTGKGGKA